MLWAFNLLLNNETIEPISKTVQTAIEVNHFPKAGLVEPKHNEASETLLRDG